MPESPLAREDRQPRPPSLLDAVLPIVVLIGLIATSIVLFGVAATDGPLQVALFVSAAFASLIAFKNGYTVAAIADAAVGGVTSAMGAVFILLAVGALIGTWNMAGTIPTVVHYGIGLLSPTWFYVASAAICALVGTITGSSWTTAGTLGVAFVGMANVLGLSENVAAGAVICGAYFGDKMTPLSETTILVPKLVGGGLTVSQHIRNMFWTAGPAIGISLVLFLIIGLNAEPKGAASTEAAQQALEGAFNITLLNLLPLLLLVVFSIRKFPPFLSILGSALFAGILACFTQWTAVQAFVNDPSLGPVATGAKAIYGSMATGFVSNTGNEAIDQLFSRGGMASLLTTVWLVLGALSFAAVVEHAGFLAPPARADRRAGEDPRQADPCGQRKRDRSERDRRRSVRRRRAARADVPGGIRRARARPAGAVPRRRGLRHRHVGPGALEHLRRIHLRGARGADQRLPALLLLQHPQPDPRRAIRVRRVQGADRCDGRTADLRRERRSVDARASPRIGGFHVSDQTTQTAEPTEGRKRRFQLPSAYTILFALIVLAAIATWIVPAGRYDLNKQGEPIPGTYHEVESHPQKIIVDSLKAPINGMYGIEDKKGNISPYNTGALFGAIDVALFILVIGGFLGVTMKTGAIQTGIGMLVRRLRGKERLMIPILMTLFAIGGSTFGMAEESLAFYVLVITVMIAAGYDALTGAAIVLLGCGIGVIGSTINPFATGIASGFAGIPISDGIVGRVILLIVGLAIGIYFVMRYAERVKKDPTRSLVYDLKAENEAHFRARVREARKRS